MADTAIEKDALKPFRLWFMAAAIYNLVWGSVVLVAPNALFRLAGMPEPAYPAIFQCVGMMVMVYALGYWYVARDPIRYGAFVWVGLLGKTFGPIGFLYAALTGQMPWSFGWTIVFNDLIWWPAFWAFALRYARNPLG